MASVSTPARTPGSAADARRLRGLRRMRALALGLLVLAAVVYALSYGYAGGLGYVNATAEAAMVGALADWFAVTALFRRPLGLPIPHTAIIPTRKEALGKSLEDFVSQNFLTEAAVRQKVAGAAVSARLGGWLVDRNHSARVVAEAARIVRSGLDVVSDDDVDALVGTVLIPRLTAERISPLAGGLLAEIVRDGAHHGLVDIATREAHRWLSGNADTVAEVVADRAPWWTPRWLDAQVTRRLHREALAWVAAVRDRPDHPARRALDDLLAELAHDLQHDPATMARAESLKERVLTHPQVRGSAVALWNAIRRGLHDAIDEPTGLLQARGVDALVGLGQRLRDDTDLQARLDGYAVDAVGYVATSFGAEVAGIISDTVNRWDGKEAARKIELHVGRDLQFIRINGTVVGGLAGLVIHTLSMLL